jgi:hypothetical protein
MSGVAAPGTQGGVKPADGKNGEGGADNLMKELFEDAPEAGKATWLGPGRSGSRCDNCCHRSSLAQIEESVRKVTRPMVQVMGTMNGLITT